MNGLILDIIGNALPNEFSALYYFLTRIFSDIAPDHINLFTDSISLETNVRINARRAGIRVSYAPVDYYEQTLDPYRLTIILNAGLEEENTPAKTAAELYRHNLSERENRERIILAFTFSDGLYSFSRYGRMTHAA